MVVVGRGSHSAVDRMLGDETALEIMRTWLHEALNARAEAERQRLAAAREAEEVAGGSITLRASPTIRGRATCTSTSASYWANV